MKYCIVSGFWSGKGYAGEDDDSKAKFFENIWWPNTLNNSNPVDIFVINSDSKIVPKKYGKWLDLSFNLGGSYKSSFFIVLPNYRSKI